MEVSAMSTNTMMTAAARQLQANVDVQTAIMKTIAQSQEQMAEILSALGIGQNIDTQA